MNARQRKELKAKAHHLKPFVRVGQKGITENLLQEADQALETHELVKVSIASDDRETRLANGLEIATKLKAEVVNQIGKICLLYRKRNTENLAS